MTGGYSTAGGAGGRVMTGSISNVIKPPLTPTASEIFMNANDSLPSPRKGGTGRYWRGEERLWKAFWLLWVLGWWAISTIAILFQKAGDLPAYSAALIILLYMLCAGAGVWRCAFNVGWRGWGHIARGVVVIFILLVVAGLFQATQVL